MKRVTLLLLSLLLTTPALAGQHGTSAPSRKTTPRSTKAAARAAPDLEPRAIALLKATSDRLSAAKSLSFTAVELFEEPSRHGHPLAYATKSDVVLQRPNRLRVIIAGDGPASEFYYDGMRMMAFAPAENLLAVADAPPTIDDTLEAAYKNAGIYFPFTDLIVANPYKDMARGLDLAYYIGQSTVIDGITTDMVAYIDNGVFIQLWIGAEDKLPHRVHAVFLNDPERLRHDLQLSNWRLDGEVAADAFAPASAGSAKRIPFANPHPQAPAKGAVN